MANNATTLSNCETLLLPSWLVSHGTDTPTWNILSRIMIIFLPFLIFALWIAVNRMLCVTEYLLSTKKNNSEPGTVESPTWNGGIHRIMFMAILNVSPIIINCFLEMYRSNFLHTGETDTSLLIVLSYGFFGSVLGLSSGLSLTQAQGVLSSLPKLKTFWCLFIVYHLVYIWLLLIIRDTGIHLFESAITVGLFPVLYFTLWTLKKKFDDAEISPLVLTNSEVETGPPVPPPNQVETIKVVKSIAYYREVGLQKRLGVSYPLYNVNDSYIDTIKSSIKVKHNESDTVEVSDWIKHVLSTPGKLITAIATIPPVWKSNKSVGVGILSVKLCFLLVTLIVIVISDLSLQLSCHNHGWSRDLTAFVIFGTWFATPDIAASIQVLQDENADSIYVGYTLLLHLLGVCFGLGLNWILMSILTNGGSLSLELEMNVSRYTFLLILFWVSSIITCVIKGIAIRRQEPANNKCTFYSLTVLYLLTMICAIVYIVFIP